MTMGKIGSLFGASLILLLASTGCSLQRMAAHSMVPIMEASLDEAYASADIATAREAIPSQLLLLRGVAQSDPDKKEIWSTAVQLYASYALIFVEQDDPDRAARLYDEGMELGLRFLHRIDWFREGWEAGPDALRAELAQRRPVELTPMLLWTAACLGKHVLNNLDKPREIADLPYAFVLVDAAIEFDGTYFYAMPHVLKGLMLTIIPPMLGGDLEGAERHFQTAFTTTNRTVLLHHVLYAEYYCVQAWREDLFETVVAEILRAPEDLNPKVRLLNLIARERAAGLREIQEDLF